MKVVTIENTVSTTYPVISIEEYKENADKMKLCISANDERLIFDVEDYFDYLPIPPTEFLAYDICEQAKTVPVCKQDKFHITADDILHTIEDKSCSYGMDYWDVSPEIDNDLINNFVKKFNEDQTWVTNGEQVAVLDLSEEVKDFYFNEFKIAPQDRESVFNEWKEKCMVF